MASPSFAEQRLSLLRQRWERDPSSRLFLQLAEEYRRHGQLGQAVEVLEKGLLAHPDYLSARVALGRCYLEVGEVAAARKALERVLTVDPTQLVANKLLVEIYLQFGDAARARERLDLYNLLNERDPEIESFEQRLMAFEGSPLAPPTTPTPAWLTAAARASRQLAPQWQEEEAEPTAEREPPVATGQQKTLTESLDRGRIAEEGEIFSLPPVAVETWGFPPPLASPLQPLEGASVRRAATPPGNPFGAVLPRTARRRVLEAFGREGIFPLELLAPPPPSAAIASEELVEEVGDLSAEEMIPRVGVDESLGAAPPQEAPLPLAEEASWEAEPLATAFAIAEASVGEEVRPATFLEAAPSAPAAEVSATLGELYLGQGHLREAEETFRAVLAARPESETARRGLEEIVRRRAAPLTAAELLAGAPLAIAAAGPMTRRIFLLRHYLERLRQGAQRYVPRTTEPH